MFASLPRTLLIKGGTKYSTKYPNNLAGDLQKLSTHLLIHQRVRVQSMGPLVHCKLHFRRWHLPFEPSFLSSDSDQLPVSEFRSCLTSEHPVLLTGAMAAGPASKLLVSMEDTLTPVACRNHGEV